VGQRQRAHPVLVGAAGRAIGVGAALEVAQRERRVRGRLDLAVEEEAVAGVNNQPSLCTATPQCPAVWPGSGTSSSSGWTSPSARTPSSPRQVSPPSP
jgi:hypothetical protein